MSSRELNYVEPAAVAERAAHERSPGMLELAGRAVEQLFAGELPGDAINALCSAVASARDGASLPSFAASPHTAVARPVLDALRRRILIAASSAGDREAYAESHALLVAIEKVHDHLCGDDLYRVVDQLGGAKALELLVEVAHDMRSPLGSILFLVDRVRSGQSGAVSDAQARQLGLAYSAAFGLSALTADVMELARGSGRLMGPAPVAFVLADVFQKVHDIVRPVAEEKGLLLHIAPVARDVRLGHPAALTRVLLNLTTNACKYTERGTVTVEARPLDSSSVAFSVRDTGRGVPPEVVSRLFDTFRPRGGSLAGEQLFSSAGLGLTICRKLVAAMGGELKLDSRDHSGSQFSFALSLSAL